MNPNRASDHGQIELRSNLSHLPVPPIPVQLIEKHSEWERLKRAMGLVLGLGPKAGGEEASCMANMHCHPGEIRANDTSIPLASVLSTRTQKHEEN